MITPRTLRRTLAALAVGLAGAALAPAALAQIAGNTQPPPIGTVTSASKQLPGPLEKVGFDQLLGSRLPLAATFRDENGERVELGRYFGERPVIVVPMYYECPMLCTLVTNGLAATLKTLALTVGEDFTVVAYSIDPGETPELAAAAKKRILARYGRDDSAAGWHFLTAEPASIAALSQAIGFRAVYDEALDEYAHTAGVVVVTPQGEVARYFFGIEFPPRDLRLSLVEAAQGTIGSVVDHVLLFCFRYNPETGRYSSLTLNVVRLGGGLTIAVMVFGIAWMLRRDRHRHSGGEGNGSETVESLG